MTQTSPRAKADLSWQVHLILRHKSPKGVTEEKHLKSPPLVLLDKKTHVYTAIIKPDATCAPPGLLPSLSGC